MSKSVPLLEKHWNQLLKNLKVDYAALPPSTFLIRNQMKNRLGFVPRHHKFWSDADASYCCIVFLDFYDEQKKTMFLLKYSDFIKT